MKESFELENVNNHIKEHGLPSDQEMRSQIEVNERTHHITELAEGLVQVALSSQGGMLFFNNYLTDINRYANGQFDEKYETTFPDWSIADFNLLLHALESKMKAIKD